MPTDPNEVGLDEIYAEVDKRIKTAIDALKAEILAELEKRFPEKKGFKVLRSGTGGA